MGRNLLETINDPKYQKSLALEHERAQKRQEAANFQVAEKFEGFRRKYANYAFSDFGELKKLIQGKSLFEQSAAIENAAKTNTGNLQDFLIALRNRETTQLAWLF